MFLGEGVNAVIIGVILAASIGLGFMNEFRAERAADALHDRIRHTAIVLRDGEPAESMSPRSFPATWSRLTTGSVVPADMRLLESHNLSCDESIVTGESLPAAKSAAAIAAEPGWAI